MLLSPSQSLRFPVVERFRWRPATVARRILSFAVRRTAPSSNGGSAPTSLESKTNQLSQSSSFPIGGTLGFRRDPELGLASVIFVMFMVMGSFFSLVVVFLPALHAFRKLAASMDKLSKVVSEEVPGTLTSLKLSDLEINDLTRQLNNLKQRISGYRYVKKERRNNPGSHEHGGRSDTVIS